MVLRPCLHWQQTRRPCNSTATSSPHATSLGTRLRSGGRCCALPRLATSAPRSTLTAFKQCQVWAEGRALRRWVRVIEPA